MAEGTIIEIVVSKTQIRQFKYYNCRDVRVGNVLESVCDVRMQSDYRLHERWWAIPVVKSSKLVVSSMKLTKRVAGFVVFLISSMVLPWALKTWKSKSHVAMRANEPAILLAEAMGHWQFRCLRPVNLQSFVCRRKIVSIHFSDLLLNSTPHAAGGKRARNALDAGGARCTHAANRYTRNTHAGKIGGCKEFKIGRKILVERGDSNYRSVLIPW